MTFSRTTNYIALGVVFALTIGFSLGSFVTSNAKTEIKNSVITTSTVDKATETQAPFQTKKQIARLELDAKEVAVLFGEVDSGSTEALIGRIQDAERNGHDLYLILDSPGGSVFDGAKLISYMEASSIKVNTVVYGLCASMCAQIFAHGKTRYMVDRTTLMYHQASGGVSGNVKGMKNLLNYIDREVQKLDAYVADRAGISRKDWDDVVSVDKWIAADDAVASHLADSLAVVSVNNDPTAGGVSLLTKRTAIKSEGNIGINPLTLIK